MFFSLEEKELFLLMYRNPETNIIDTHDVTARHSQQLGTSESHNVENQDHLRMIEPS